MGAGDKGHLSFCRAVGIILGVPDQKVERIAKGGVKDRKTVSRAGFGNIRSVPRENSSCYY